MLLALRGTPVLYYGDEIGMPETVVPPDRELDPVARVGKRPGRDRCRTPMHWSSEPGAGFTTAGTEPWLPFGDASACNVADQRGDPSSPLSLTRDLIALRRELPDLRVRAYEALRSPDGVWAWRRGAHTVVALNLSDRDLVQEDLSGTIRLSTHRERASETVQGRVELAPWEGVVLHGD